MHRVHTYRDVVLPDRFDEWQRDAKVNFLCNAMDREQIIDIVRESHGLNQTGKDHLNKDELAEIVVVDDYE